MSYAAAHKALGKARHRLADCAAAVDAITVIVTVTGPGALATELLLRNPRRSNYLIAVAAGCDEATVRRARHRLERAGEILAYVTEERQPRAPSGQPPGTRRAPPQIQPLPKPPDWSQGTCAHVPRSQRTWWTSADPILREAAANLCQTCPILAPCAEFSLSLPVTDNAVYAGMSQAERLRRKRTGRRLAAEPRPSPRNL